MLFAEKESNIIEAFQVLKKREIGLFPNCAESRKICRSVLSDKEWSRWTDSSGKDMPPPDFYNDHEGLMMEVMRVDDHGFRKKGKVINPSLVREHEIERELRESGFLGQFPDSFQLLINADSGLTTTEDHNYTYYRDNFRRIVEDHKAKIANYKKNHPGYKMIFFVFDESSAYVLMEKVPEQFAVGQMARGEAHLWFADKRFVEIFHNSEIDYLIWFAPYKLIQTRGRAPVLPVACVFDCNKINYQLTEYDPSHMVSSEV